jgi:hypothetical protein
MDLIEILIQFAPEIIVLLSSILIALLGLRFKKLKEKISQFADLIIDLNEALEDDELDKDELKILAESLLILLTI